MHPDECMTKDELLENDIADAEELRFRCNQALIQLTRGRPQYREDEVGFRNEALKGVLKIAISDIAGMVEAWKDELHRK